LALLITTTAAAPSVIGDEDPAVMVPSAANAGRSFPRLAAVVSGRMPSSASTRTGSPLRCGTLTGVISSANRPLATARPARWCDCAANSSCSALVSWWRPLCFSVEAPIET